jgi:hypothetical protein
MVHPQQIARQAVMSDPGKHKRCWLIQIASACCPLEGLVPEDWNLESASGVSPSRSAAWQRCSSELANISSVLCWSARRADESVWRVAGGGAGEGALS